MSDTPGSLRTPVTPDGIPPALRGRASTKSCTRAACTWLLPALGTLLGVVLIALLIKLLASRTDGHGASAEAEVRENINPTPVSPNSQDNREPHLVAENVPAFPVHDTRDERPERHAGVPAGIGSAGGSFTAYESSNAPEYTSKGYGAAHSAQSTPGTRSYASEGSTGARALNGQEVAERIFNRKETAVVMFHAHWCGACKSTMPEYEKAARLARLPFYAVEDANGGSELAERLGINAYPTIVRFEQGHAVKEYEGARDADSLSRFGS